MTKNRSNLRLLRHMAALVAALCALLALCAAHAETVEVVVEAPSQTVTVTGGLTNDEAAAGYIHSILYPNARRPRSANLGEKLTGANKNLYELLVPMIKDVADGERQSTVFNVPVEDVFRDFSMSAKELGVESILYESEDGWHIDNTAYNAFFAELHKVFDLKTVINALLGDYPYEMYWFDGTVGFDYSDVIMTASMEVAQVAGDDNGNFKVNLAVAAEYALSEEEGTFEFDRSKYGYYKVATAAENAQSIVTANASKSDYEKLVAYKQAICDAVEYNHAAADKTKSTPYGNPWQLIWVFDDNPDTKVVCEGYSKAFQYLCDLTKFNGNVSAICATGTMAGGTGAGPHMWNIVTMNNGENYLVDVTNCDEGTVGSPAYLFMKGYVFKAQEYEDYYKQYNFSCGDQGDIIYVYDQDTLDTFGDMGRLALSGEDYDPDQNPDPTPDPTSDPGNKWGDLTWSLDDDGTLTISGTGPMKTGESDDDFYYYPWNGLPGSEDMTITKVVIGEGVTSIAEEAFSKLSSLETAVLPSTLTLIDKKAFWSCSNLSEVTIPDSVTTIDRDAFYQSTGVTIRCHGNAPAYAWYLENEDDLILDLIPYANTLTLPDSTTTIDSQAFADLDVPVNVVIPANVTSITSDAFEGSDVLLLYVEGTKGARAIDAYLAALGTDALPTPTRAADTVSVAP